MYDVTDTKSLKIYIQEAIFHNRIRKRWDNCMVEQPKRSTLSRIQLHFQKQHSLLKGIYQLPIHFVAFEIANIKYWFIGNIFCFSTVLSLQTIYFQLFMNHTTQPQYLFDFKSIKTWIHCFLQMQPSKIIRIWRSQSP